MQFVVTVSFAIEADSEQEAREIADSVELSSPHQGSILWKLRTEVEEAPDR